MLESFGDSNVELLARAPYLSLTIYFGRNYDRALM